MDFVEDWTFGYFVEGWIVVDFVASLWSVTADSDQRLVFGVAVVQLRVVASAGIAGVGLLFAAVAGTVRKGSRRLEAGSANEMNKIDHDVVAASYLNKFIQDNFILDARKYMKLSFTIYME